MINTLLVFDENDKDLGNFFSMCKEDLDEFFDKNEIFPEIIDKISNFEIMLPFKINNFKSEKFVFAAFTHGDKSNLLQSGTNSFVSVSQNLEIFNDSFFYTFACETGKILGQELIKHGCICFIGYDKKTHIWNTFQRPFIDTAVYGLKLFFEGEYTKTIFLKMKERYNEEIDKMYQKDYVIASILMDNRDALVLYGKNINIDEMK